MASPPLDPEADFYRRCREVLGRNAGGMATSLLRAKGGNLALARAAIETAATRGDAREYVGAMIRHRGGAGAPRSGNGFAALLVEHQREQENQREDYHGDFVGGTIIEAEPVSDRIGHRR